MVAVSYGDREEKQGELSVWTEEISEIIGETSERHGEEAIIAEKEHSLMLNLSLLSGNSQSPAITERNRYSQPIVQDLSLSFDQNTTAVTEATKPTDSELPSPGRILKRERKLPPPFHLPDPGVQGSSPLPTETVPKPVIISTSPIATKRPVPTPTEENKESMGTKAVYETFGTQEFAAAKEPGAPLKQSERTDLNIGKRHKTPPKLPDTVLKPLISSDAVQTTPSAISGPKPSIEGNIGNRKLPETPKRPPAVIIPSAPTLQALQLPDPSPSQFPIALPIPPSVPTAPVLSLPTVSCTPEAPKLNTLLVPITPVLPIQPLSASSVPQAPVLTLSPGFPTAPSLSIPPPAPSLSLRPAAPLLSLKPGVAPTLIPGLNLPKAAVPQALKTAVSKLKPVRIDPVTPDKVKNTIWEKAQSPTLVLSDLELYFGRAAAKAANIPESKTAPTTAISLLCDEKRVRAFDMAYSRVKKIGLEAFEEILIGLKSTEISDNLLETLRTVVPTLEERNAAMDNTEELEKLNSASQLLVRICAIPRFAVRLTALKLQRTARNTIAEVSSQCELIQTAMREVTSSHHFSVFLASVLSIGNALNDGTPRGNAAGFKLTCLPQVLSMRDNSGKETLLSYLIRVLILQNPTCLQFPADFPSLKSAALISFEQVSAEAQSLRQSIDTVSIELSRGKSTGDEQFVAAVETWLPGLVGEAQRVGELVLTVKEQSGQTAKYLGEDGDTKLQPEDLFKVVLEIGESVQRCVSAATSKLKRR